MRIDARMRFVLFSLLLACCLGANAAAIPKAIESCMLQNLPQSTSSQSIELRARDRSGYEQVLEADVFWKRFADGQSRALMYFHEPADIRGGRFLVIGKPSPEGGIAQNEMYIYMTSLFKVRRITSRNISNSIMGTDFSYEDFERLQGILSDMHAEQYPDAEVSGNPVHVLMSYPDANSGYVKIASYIDKKSCIPLRIELYEHGNQLRKLMTVDPAAIRNQDGTWIATELLMRDLRDKTQTRLVVQDIRLGMQLDDDLFNPEKLKQVIIPEIKSQ
jgi:outer membrane lipoprotein-sorting protein